MFSTSWTLFYVLVITGLPLSSCKSSYVDVNATCLFVIFLIASSRELCKNKCQFKVCKATFRFYIKAIFFNYIIMLHANSVLLYIFAFKTRVSRSHVFLGNDLKINFRPVRRGGGGGQWCHWHPQNFGSLIFSPSLCYKKVLLRAIKHSDIKFSRANARTFQNDYLLK